MKISSPRNHDKEKGSKKVCIITGATSGLGKEIAIGMAKTGNVVIGVGRDPEKCVSVEFDIRRETNNVNVDYLCADFSSQSSIRKVAGTIKERCPQLHVLVNNVGAIFPKRELSIDGIEKTIALNHLGPFLFTNQLVEILILSQPAKILNISSGLHIHGTMDFLNFQFESGYEWQKAYARSKLANLLFTYELARKLKGSGVTVNAVNPGLLQTGLGLNIRDLKGLSRIVASRILGRSPKEAAEFLVELAMNPNYSNSHGVYYSKGNPVRSSQRSYDLDAAGHLWEVSLDLTREADDNNPAT